MKLHKKGKFAQLPQTRDLRKDKKKLPKTIGYNSWTKIYDILVL